MKHYEVGEWTDFVRGLVSEQVRMEMEQHQAGCTKCGALVDLLQGVARAARDEKASESASSQLAASARSVFTRQPALIRKRDRVIETLQTLVAHLTYDSALNPRPAGARSLADSSRQMLYEAGEYSVDLRFDQETESARTVLVGQVANRKEPSRSMSMLSVAMHSGTAVLATAFSNQFGEFELDYLPQPSMRLRISLADAGLRLEIPLEQDIDERKPE